MTMKSKFAGLMLGVAAAALPASAHAGTTAPHSGTAAAQDMEISDQRMRLAMEAVNIYWPEGQAEYLVDYMMGPFADRLLTTPIPQLAEEYGMREMFETFAALENMGMAEEGMPSQEEMKAGADMMIAMLGDKTIMSLIADEDEYFEERLTIVRAVLSEELPTVMEEVEPTLRSALAQAFAARFTDAELAGIAAFAATPVGQKFAREYMLLGFEPAYSRGMMKIVPAFIETMPALMTKMEERTAHLPPLFGIEQDAEEEDMETDDPAEGSVKPILIPKPSK